MVQSSIILLTVIDSPVRIKLAPSNRSNLLSALARETPVHSPFQGLQDLNAIFSIPPD